jgi:hypothetical protein
MARPARTRISQLAMNRPPGVWVNFGLAQTPDESSVATKLFLQPYLNK